MQRYVQNQSKKVAKNKIVMETNANKTTLFFQLLRKRCFFVGSKLVGSSRCAGPSSEYQLSGLLPLRGSLLIILINIIEEDRESFFE